MGQRYTVTEVAAIDRLLTSLPMSANSGCLPFLEWSKTPEWQTLLKGGHTDGSVKAYIGKRWRSRSLPVQTKPQEKQLNHAYNFCPGCGFKLN